MISINMSCRAAWTKVISVELEDVNKLQEWVNSADPSQLRAILLLK